MIRRRWLLQTEALGRRALGEPLARFWTHRAAIRAARFVGDATQDVVVDGRTGEVVHRVIPNDLVTIAAPFDRSYTGQVTRIAAERSWVGHGWQIVPEPHTHGAWCHPSADGCPDDLR